MQELPEGWRVIEGGKVDPPEKPLLAMPVNLTHEAIDLLMQYYDALHNKSGVASNVDSVFYEEVKEWDLYKLYRQLHNSVDENVATVPKRLALMKAITEHPVFQSKVFERNDQFHFTD